MPDKWGGQEQGKKVLDIVINNFYKNEGNPDLYIISPFTTVIDELKDMINQSKLNDLYKGVEQWCDKSCGTVHKFQGKEAKEVIFILGCDKRAVRAVKWVKPNILNVAVTRAKYRLYIVGDVELWCQSEIFKTAYSLLDKF